MNRFHQTVAAVSLSLLAGACAVPDSGQANTALQASAAPAPIAAEPAVNATPVQNSQPEAQPLDNPVTVTFDENSTQLSDGHRDLVKRIVAEAGDASQIILTGLCDRAAAGNAREVAIARAVAMRSALRAAGSSVKNVRIKYRTAQPIHGVMVAWIK